MCHTKEQNNKVEKNLGGLLVLPPVHVGDYIHFFPGGEEWPSCHAQKPLPPLPPHCLRPTWHHHIQWEGRGLPLSVLIVCWDAQLLALCRQLAEHKDPSANSPGKKQTMCDQWQGKMLACPQWVGCSGVPEVKQGWSGSHIQLSHSNDEIKSMD